ncbi:MAG: hypothetical protein ACREPB_10940 [Arenimonas sp.]
MRFIVIAFCLLLSFECLAARWSKPEYSGTKTDAELEEMSGLAPSQVHKDILWVINDGGNGEKLIAMGIDAARVATFTLKGVKNTDWEDLASFKLNDKNYLLIADTGDNGGIRKTLQILVFEEPRSLKDGQTLEPAWTFDFKWPDGARDCESVAVDAIKGEILLISKKRVPPELFRLPLQPSSKNVVATKIGELPGIEQPDTNEMEKNPVYGRYRSQITAADLSPNGRVLIVLNYHAIYFYVREDANASWNSALSSKPYSISFPWLPQAEAITFNREGNAIYIGSEQRPVPLLRYRIIP